MTLKGLKVRIYPNKTQKLLIQCNFGYTRFVWNQMLHMLIERYENNPKAPFLNAYALNLLLPALKREYDWLGDVYMHRKPWLGTSTTWSFSQDSSLISKTCKKPD